MGELGHVGTMILALIVLAVAANLFGGEISILLALCSLLYIFFATQKFNMVWLAKNIWDGGKDKSIMDRIRMLSIVLAALLAGLATIAVAFNVYVVLSFTTQALLYSKYLAVLAIISSIWHFNR